MIGGVPAGVSLPCPFCGSPPIGNIQQNAAKVRCSNEDCGADVGPWYDLGNGNALAKAAERWNTRATPTPPIEGRDADVERDREVLREAVKAASVAEVCAALATHYDSRGNAQVANGLAPAAHRVSRAYEQHLVAIRAALQALGERP